LFNSENKWHFRFLELSKLVSTWSKDPSTQTGAVIVDSNKRIISVGYNGLPSRVSDSSDILNNRDIKYQSIIHCEINALLFSKTSLDGCTLYTYPFQSCSNCASQVIQAGITKHVFPKISKDTDLFLRWKDKFDLSNRLFSEAGVELVEVDFE